MDKVELSADGNLVAIIDRNTLVSVWDAQLGQRVDAYPIDRNVVLAVEFSPDGALMFSGGGDSAFYLWQMNDAPAPQIIARIPAHIQRIMAAAFSGDGRLIASGDDGHLIRLWERASHRLLYTLDGHTSSISSLAFSPDGQ